MVVPAFSVVDLKETLSLETLPGMPQTAARLIRLARDPSQGPAELAVVIETDPGLTAQVLRLVNSSFFGFPCQISSVKQAIALLGIRAITNFVLCQAIFQAIPDARCVLFDRGAYWRDSLRRALFARTLGKLLAVPDVEELFAAGLLQDMAIPLLARKVPDEYSRFFYACNTSKHRVRLSQLEEHVFGWNHAIAAGIVARKWQLPETLAALIESHLTLEQSPLSSKECLGKQIVAMSAILPSDKDTNWVELPTLEEAYSQVRPAGGPSIENLLRQVDEGFAEIAPLLRIAASRTSLVEKYRSIASTKGSAPPAAAVTRW